MKKLCRRRSCLLILMIISFGFLAWVLGIFTTHVKVIHTPKTYYIYKDYTMNNTGHTRAESMIIKAIPDSLKKYPVLIINLANYSGSPFDAGVRIVRMGIFMNKSPAHYPSGWEKETWPSQTMYLIKLGNSDLFSNVRVNFALWVRGIETKSPLIRRVVPGGGYQYLIGSSSD
ncbi:MAG: hypothetical protein WCY67_03200 [Acidithiobacillus sp.]